MLSGASADAGTLCVWKTCFHDEGEELLLCCLYDCRGEVTAATDGHCYQQWADVDPL